MNALTVFHASTAKIAAQNSISPAAAQKLLFDRMVTERPDIARKVLNALLAEMPA